MPELFTKSAGKKETTRGVFLGFLAGIFVASGFYALNQAIEMFSPPIDAGITLFFFIITTYELRKRLAGKGVQSVEAVSDLANSKKKTEPQTRPYQPGQKEPKEYLEYIANLFEQKSKNNLDQIVVLVGFDDAHRVDEVLEQAGEINLHTADIKRSPLFGSRNPCIELRYQDTIDDDLIETDARALKGWHATDISAVGISQETLQMLHYWYGEKSCPVLVAKSG